MGLTPSRRGRLAYGFSLVDECRDGPAASVLLQSVTILSAMTRLALVLREIGVVLGPTIRKTGLPRASKPGSRTGTDANCPHIRTDA